MLKGIHSILIWTEDMKRLLPFYRDLLGLKPEMESEGFAAFSLNGVVLGIGNHSQVRGEAKDPNRVMVDFGVDDCQGEYERLSKQGVEFTRTPTKEGDLIIATFLDPDGNVLQLFQEG